MHQMFPAFHLPEHVDGRGALRSTGLRGLHLPLLGHRRAWTLSRTRRRSSSQKLSEGWIAQVPRALTRFPPCLKARRQGERAQVPRALIRPPRHLSGAQFRGQRGAQVPKALTRNPEGAWRGETQVPRALRCSHPYPRGPVPREPENTGAEGPEMSWHPRRRIDRGRGP